MRRVKSNQCIFLIALVHVTIFVPTGLNLVVLNPIGPTLQTFVNESFHLRYNITPPTTKLKVIVNLAQSMMMIGAAFGAFSTPLWLNYLSLKLCLAVIHLVCIASIILMSPVTYAFHAYEALIMGRLIDGFVKGVSFSLGPLYIAEITSRKTVAVDQAPQGWILMVSAGFANIIAHPELLGSLTTWPYAVALPVIFSILYLFAYPWVPHTIPHHVHIEKQNQWDDLEEGFDMSASSFLLLERLRHAKGQALVEEYEEIRSEIAAERHLKETPIRKILATRKYQRQMLAVVILQLTLQATGLPVLVQFTNTIVALSGLSPEYSNYYALGIYAVLSISVIIGASLLIHFGSKKVIVGGLFIVVAAQILLCVSQALTYIIPGMGIVGTVSLALLTMGAASGPLMTVSAYPSEITTTMTRPHSLWIGATFFWVISSVITFIFPVSSAAIHGFAFIPFIMLAILLTLCVLFLVPSVHRRPVHQIQQFFEDSKNQDYYPIQRLLTNDSE